jgi:hypothetical protein
MNKIETRQGGKSKGKCVNIIHSKAFFKWSESRLTMREAQVIFFIYFHCVRSIDVNNVTVFKH